MLNNSFHFKNNAENIAKLTFSMESAAEKTMNANPRDLPVLGSVFTLIDSISP